MLADGDGHLCLCVEGQEHLPRFAIEGAPPSTLNQAQSSVVALATPSTPAGRQLLSASGPAKVDTDTPALLVIEVSVFLDKKGNERLNFSLC